MADFFLYDWFDCGAKTFKEESPPDGHPNNYWGNNKKASDGITYLGLVVRDNLTFESIGQKLNVELDSNKCYKLTMDLSKSEQYQSWSKMRKEAANYIDGCVLRIWAGHRACQSKELLAISSLVNHYSWKTYQFKINPKNKYWHIILEAFYKIAGEILLVYNGNILLDNMQNIEEIKCSEIVVPLISK